MIDIVDVTTADLGLYDTQVPRGANILSVQIGSLEYAPDIGIDLDYFLKDDFRFQNSAFKSYLVTVLANKGINVVSVIESIESLYAEYIYDLAADKKTDGFIAR